MSHTGGKEGTYPGTRASATMIGDDETNWGTKSLAILDMQKTFLRFHVEPHLSVDRQDALR